MTLASVLNRAIMPALSRLKLHTAGVTFPSAMAGKRSNQRRRSKSPHARPSTPHLVTSYQFSFGSGGAVAAGCAAEAWLLEGGAGFCAWRTKMEVANHVARRTGNFMTHDHGCSWWICQRQSRARCSG